MKEKAAQGQVVMEGRQSTQSEQVGVTAQQDSQPEVRPVLKIALSKGVDGSWSTVNRMKNSKNNSVTKTDSAPDPGQVPMTSPAQNVNQSIGNVAENVTSFLSGIRASFRSDNVYVGSIRQKKIGSPVKN